MIARFIQHLTLFAFTAHAVMGCCLHHTHANGAKCSGEDIASEHESSHHHEGQCCHSHGDAACAEEAAANGGQPPFVTEAICYECSHEHSHQCNEAHCSFAPAKVKPLDFEIDLVVWVPLFDDVNGALLTKRHPTGIDDRIFNRLALSSGQRCVSLQSWQI